MMKFFRERIGQCGRMDWAVLFMRLFAGGMMLMHNIGKIQRYDEIIASYPSFLFIEQRSIFVIVSACEVMLSLLIIVGLCVREAALWMALVIAMLIASGVVE